MGLTAGVRPAHVAGAFYPGNAEVLTAEVATLLEAARAQGGPVPPGGPAGTLAGLAVPHAGYRYSGPVAAAAYARLASERPAPAHLAVLGPAHFVARRGASVPSVDAWETPLGRVAIDPDLRAAAVAGGAWVDDRPHATEHAVEVQLPFLTVVCPGVPVLPVALSDVEPDPVADLIERLTGVPGTLIVVSTDLSHYLDQARARLVDERTALAIEARDETRIGPEDACGVYALRGAVRWAGRHALVVRRVRLATSADTAGGPERVVGYGAFTMERPGAWGPPGASTGSTASA
jgi:hypothetical protein